MNLRLISPRARVLAALVAVALLVGGPSLAAAAFDALNADKVDGRHAVAAGATPANRAGKLVATNAGGRLPNNIIAKVPDAARLGGTVPGAYQRRVTGTCSAGTHVNAVTADGDVDCQPDLVDGGNAQTLDGRDSSSFRLAPNRTVSVGPVGTATENMAALKAALTSVASLAASGTNPWVVSLEPGTYDLAGSRLAIPAYVTLVGSGRGTVITGNGPADDFDEYSVQMSTRSGLRALVLRVTVANDNAGAVTLSGPQATLRDVTIEVNGQNARGVFLRTQATNTAFTRVRVVATATVLAIALTSDADLHVRDADLTAVGAQYGAALAMAGAAQVHVTSSRLRAESANTAVGIGPAASAVVHSSRLIAVGGSISAALASVTDIKAASSLLQGPITAFTSATCVGAYNGSYAPLNAGCQ